MRHHLKYVLDASVAIGWCLAEEAHPGADAMLERLIKAPGMFAVPELFFFEDLSVLARCHNRNY